MEKFPTGEQSSEIPSFERYLSSPRKNDLMIQKYKFDEAKSALEQAGVTFESRQLTEGTEGTEPEFAFQLRDPQHPSLEASDEYVISVWKGLRAQGLNIQRMMDVETIESDSK